MLCTLQVRVWLESRNYKAWLVRFGRLCFNSEERVNSSFGCFQNIQQVRIACVLNAPGTN